ncbi:MAG: hypothetical protein ACI93T_004109, partial [Porticoccaceae bacterium]
LNVEINGFESRLNRADQYQTLRETPQGCSCRAAI